MITAITWRKRLLCRRSLAQTGQRNRWLDTVSTNANIIPRIRLKVSSSCRSSETTIDGWWHNIDMKWIRWRRNGAPSAGAKAIAKQDIIQEVQHQLTWRSWKCYREVRQYFFFCLNQEIKKSWYSVFIHKLPMAKKMNICRNDIKRWCDVRWIDATRCLSTWNLSSPAEIIAFICRRAGCPECGTYQVSWWFMSNNPTGCLSVGNESNP